MHPPGRIPGSSFELPFPCPLDHVLELESGLTKPLDAAHFGNQTEIREYSFLENSKVGRWWWVVLVHVQCVLPGISFVGVLCVGYEDAKDGSSGVSGIPGLLSLQHDCATGYLMPLLT